MAQALTVDSATSALSVTGAKLALGGKDILRGIDVALPRGEVIALLGASGCGKTTLLRAIAGLAALDGGRIDIGGRDVTAAPPQARGVGVVFQHYALFPNLSVIDNVEFGVRADGLPRAEATRRARELLALVGLEAEAGRRPGRLSGGQRQRVALARALARHPSLLLMDEPFSALDESFRVPLRRGFRALQRTLDQSCLVVTHDRDEAFELADRVAVMFDGRIAQCDAPAALWARPASRRVAEFLGVFNLLPASAAPGAARRDNGHYALPVAACRLTDTGDGASVDDASWSLEGSVRDTWRGAESTSVEIDGPAGTPLSVRLEAGACVPARGARVRVAVAGARAAWLPD